MDLGTETGSLVNHVYSRSAGAVPEVGLGVTVLAWTDRYAATIIELLPNGGFICREDRAERTDANGMSESQEYAYTPDPDGCVYTFRPVARGKAKGQLRENGRKDGCGVIVGLRQKYHDFSF